MIRRTLGLFFLFTVVVLTAVILWISGQGGEPKPPSNIDYIYAGDGAQAVCPPRGMEDQDEPLWTDSGGPCEDEDRDSHVWLWIAGGVCVVLFIALFSWGNRLRRYEIVEQ